MRFLPNFVANAALPITGALAALLLLLALAVKLSRRVDDDVQAYRLATVLIVVGATLYYGPLVFAVEATSQGYLKGFGQFFTSNTNVAVALPIMWVSLLGVIVVAGWLFVRTWNAATRSMARRLTPPQEQPTQERVPVVQ
jgi:small-conductance mechanosensitive channel